MTKAVLFGSLSSMADFTGLERQAFNRAFVDHGVALHWSPETYRAVMHRHGRFTGLFGLRDALDGRDPLPIYQSVEAHFRDLLDTSEVEPDPWFVSAVTTLRRKGIRLALVTGAFRQTTVRALATLFRTRASVVFDTFTSAEDGAAQKPEPDLHMLALKRLGVSPERAMAIEVTPDGVDAAKRAGLFTVAQETQAVPSARLSHADDLRAETLELNLSRAFVRRAKPVRLTA